MQKNHAAIAANRFGLGAKPGDIKQAGSDPQAWLIQQMTPALPPPDSANIGAMLTLYQTYNQTKRVSKNDRDNRIAKAAAKASSKAMRKAISTLIGATLTDSIAADNSLSWRLVDFFSNHFSVSNDGKRMSLLAPLLERDAIAPNIYHHFEDLLLAVIHHPAMLIYLNNEKSIGPDSKAARGKSGLNENLAREILELHTLGVDGGYSQQDVIELAEAITGWSVSFNGSAKTRKNKNSSKRKPTPSEAGYAYLSKGHQPGTRTILGVTYAANDEEQGRAILTDLARHPSTAAHVSWKLARHFIADEPSTKLVKAMTQRWLDTNGDLRQVITTLIQHPDAWLAEQQKLKTPREFIQSACRATGRAQWQAPPLLKALAAMGQQPFEAGSPAGYGDTAEHWHGGTAMLGRIEWSNQFADEYRLKGQNLALSSLGSQLSDHSLTIIKRAESQQQSATLWLMSPEFQHR